MVFLVWWANSHSARLHRHYSSWDELRRIAREDIGADWSLLSGRDVYKSYNARMIHPLKNGDLTEVLSSVTRMRRSACARLRISLSPGSSSHSPAHTTSCPRLSRNSLAPPQTDASRRSFTVLSPPAGIRLFHDQ